MKTSKRQLTGSELSASRKRARLLVKRVARHKATKITIFVVVVIACVVLGDRFDRMDSGMYLGVGVGKTASKLVEIVTDCICDRLFPALA